jgi:cyclopropane fatty-acyl-phospholipid synthase-like methyltransferase
MLNWQNFWSNNPPLFGVVMQKNSVYFADKLLKAKTILPENSILDFGCGPGYLADLLKNKVASYYGVDISADCVENCKQKFAGYENMQFSKVISTETTTGLEETVKKGLHFDVIIVLSVVQYFSGLAKAETLLSDWKSMLSDGGKIILADVIPSHKGLLKDVYSGFADSIQKGYFLSFLRFLFQARFSNYHQLRLDNDLLCITETDIASICQKLQLQYAIMPICTLQHSRVSYCITGI